MAAEESSTPLHEQEPKGPFAHNRAIFNAIAVHHGRHTQEEVEAPPYAGSLPQKGKATKSTPRVKCPLCEREFVYHQELRPHFMNFGKACPVFRHFHPTLPVRPRDREVVARVLGVQLEPALPKSKAARLQAGVLESACAASLLNAAGAEASPEASSTVASWRGTELHASDMGARIASVGGASLLERPSHPSTAGPSVGPPAAPPSRRAPSLPVQLVPCVDLVAPGNSSSQRTSIRSACLGPSHRAKSASCMNVTVVTATDGADSEVCTLSVCSLSVCPEGNVQMQSSTAFALTHKPVSLVASPFTFPHDGLTCTLLLSLDEDCGAHLLRLCQDSAAGSLTIMEVDAELPGEVVHAAWSPHCSSHIALLTLHGTVFALDLQTPTDPRQVLCATMAGSSAALAFSGPPESVAWDPCHDGLLAVAQGSHVWFAHVADTSWRHVLGRSSTDTAAWPVLTHMCLGVGTLLGVTQAASPSIFCAGLSFKSERQALEIGQKTAVESDTVAVFSAMLPLIQTTGSSAPVQVAAWGCLDGAAFLGPSTRQRSGWRIRLLPTSECGKGCFDLDPAHSLCWAQCTATPAARGRALLLAATGDICSVQLMQTS